MRTRCVPVGSKMTIHVLCSSCNTHLADTDINRLDWPLMGEMFSVVFPGWYLRPGMMNLDVFCPACGAFPFHYNPHEAGGNAVGKNLTVMGADGKPVVMSIKQILVSASCLQFERSIVHGDGTISKEPCDADYVPLSSIKEAIKKEFPCPTCGAKKRFHKKGCALKISAENILKSVPPATQEAVIEMDKHARLSELKDRDRAHNPLVASIAGRVQGMSADKGDGPPTEREIQEVLADRQARRMEAGKDVDVRPGEGYMEKRA